MKKDAIKDDRLRMLVGEYEYENSKLKKQLNAIKVKTSVKEWLKILPLRTKILKANLFDEKFYRKQLEGLGLSVNENFLNHFIFKGYLLGLNPNPLFDCKWYLSENADVAESEGNPFLHYLSHGERESRDPHPLFSVAYYNSQLSERMTARSSLEHFLSANQPYLNPHPKFDAEWYLEKNPDVKEAKQNPLVHYMLFGHKEFRDPHPEFNEAWYKQKYKGQLQDQLSGAEHFARVGVFDAIHTNPNQALKSRIRLSNDHELKNLLVVAHSASERIYGAERSLLDVLSVIDKQQFNVILALPSNNLAYLEAVDGMVDEVVKYQREWWQSSSAPSEYNLNLFENLMRERKIDLVYTNTIVIETPSVVAQKLGIPCVTHVRELISEDEELESFIGIPSNEIIESVVKRNTLLIANSKYTKKVYGGKGNIICVPNAIDVKSKRYVNEIPAGKPLRVGMLSSNIGKKGLKDFFQLAVEAENRNLPIEFYAYGPETGDVRMMKSKMEKFGKPRNLFFPGYVSEIEQAIQSVNVIVNLSHFAESFGRTALEGMAFSRPVIAYSHGALPEVIVDGKSGYLVPYLNFKAVVPYLVGFLKAPEKLNAMGVFGQSVAKEKFSREILAVSVNAALETALVWKTGTVDSVFNKLKTKISSLEVEKNGEQIEFSVVVPNYNYDQFLEERLESIIFQSLRPSEIIFLDDCSTDRSVQLARSILQKWCPELGISFKIIRNKTNKGVYAQWIRGISASRYDWVWIAEADDVSKPAFLETLSEKITDNTVLVYSQSQKIDENGAVLASSNLEHTNDVSEDKWLRDYVETGIREVKSALVYRNTIPNVSAAIIRKSAAKEAVKGLKKYRFCGDWYFYLKLLRQGEIAYSSQSLNLFRRHRLGVTRKNSIVPDYLIEVAKIREFVCREYSILNEQLERMDWFFNRDYTIAKIKKNVNYYRVKPILNKAKNLTLKRRKIAIITTNNGSFNGGSEVLWQEVAEQLLIELNDVHILIKKWKPAPEIISKLRKLGAKIHFKEDSGFELLVNEAPDLVLISTGDQDEGTEYFSTLIQKGISYVIVNQLTKEPRFWKIRENKTEKVKEGYLFADKTFFTCLNNASVMERRLGVELKKVAIHFNPYHIDRKYVPRYPSVSNGMRIAVPSKLLFLHKGQDLLINALPKLPWKEWGVVFNFYGEGPDEPNLRQMIKVHNLDNCIIKGKVDDISEIWRDNHALLMPSRMEGLPIMVVSAMLSARMCIVTDIGGHSEVVTDGKSGIIIDEPETESVSIALLRAVSQKEHWEKMGKQARSDILDYLPISPTKHFIHELKNIL